MGDLAQSFLAGMAARRARENDALAQELQREHMALSRAAQERQWYESNIHLQNLIRQQQEAARRDRRETMQEETAPDLGAFRTLEGRYPSEEAAKYVGPYAEAGRRLARDPRAIMRAPSFMAEDPSLYPVGPLPGGAEGPPEPMTDVPAGEVRDYTRGKAYGAFEKAMARATKDRAAARSGRPDHTELNFYRQAYLEEIRDASRLLGQFADIDVNPETQAKAAKIGIRSPEELRARVQAERKRVQLKYQPIFQKFGVPLPLDPDQPASPAAPPRRPHPPGIVPYTGE